MIIFLYGPDDYRRIRRKNDLIAAFAKKYSNLGMAEFDGDADGALDKLAEFLRSQSIFETSKMAILENAFEIDPSKLAKALTPFAEGKGTTVLICEREKPVKVLAFLLKVPVVVEQFESLKDAEWTTFIKKEAAKLGMKLGDSAAQFLGTVYQGNSWALLTELEKLAAMKGSFADNPVVEKKDLDALDLETAPNYWMLLNGLKSQDGRTRLATLERLFALNDPPPKIFNILAAQAGDSASRMAEYDFAIKSGKMDYEEALLDLILA